VAESYPKSQATNCDAPQQETQGSDATTPLRDYEGYAEHYENGLLHWSGSEYYRYTWKTDKKWTGTCRQFIIQLNDGTYHQANAQFK
jgi:hypothetical protein